MMKFLIGIIILIGFLIFAYFYVVFKLKKITKEYFNTTDLKKALELSKINDEDTPKSLGSLDSIYLSKFQKDFPDMNLNELKRLSESFILEIFDSIENKNIDKLHNKNEKIMAFINSKIDDYKNIKVKFTKLKIHNTVLNKYEVHEGFASLYLATAFEYYENNKKIQNRMKFEYIYIIDPKKVKENLKVLGLNCPNCGAPITSLEHKKCSYCNSGIIDFIKKSFVLNDIIEY